MSNTGQIRRYTSYDDDRVTVDRNGKFVKYEDYKRLHRSMAEIRKERDVLIRRVAELEKQDVESGKYIERLTGHNRKIFKVVSSFNGGLTPVGCDGVIMLKVDEYNSLVQAINAAE